MTPASDHNYQKQMTEEVVQRWLTGLFTSLLKITVALLVLQVACFAYIVVFRCSTIKGVSVSGRIFMTDSITCPNPDVVKLYQRREN